MKKYWTMMTRDYLSHWTVCNGVREYVSNMLDSPAASEYEISDDFIILTSKDITLPATIFVMGYSQNRKDDEAVGQFGEGALVAMVPLLREGKGLHFINGDVIWKPAFEFNESLGLEVLVINEEPNPHPTNDYSVVIDNLTPEEVQEIRESCTYFRDDLGEVLEGRTGQVIKGVQGKLFVGGIFVCDIPKHVNSYNFKSKYLPLNRDRRSCADWDLAVQAQRLLDEVESPENIAKLIASKAQDVYYAKFGVDAPVADAVFNDFVEVHGEKVVANDWVEAANLTNKGYKDVFIVGNETQTKAIQRSTAYQDFLETVDIEVEEVDNTTPIEMLESWASTFSFEYSCDEVSFNELLDLFRKRGVEFTD